MTPPPGGTFLRITLPLAGLNFINQASRGILALLAPLLAVEFGLTASALGLLAAILFAAYALAQLPVGLALDLYGARRVQLVLGSVAATGFALSALAEEPLLFALGRVLTGLGVSAGLMAMMKANVQWFPPQRVAGATGTGLFIAGAGGAVATWPVQLLLPHVGWRGAFWLLMALTLAIVAWIAASVPRGAPGPAAPRRGLLAEAAEFGRIFAHPRFLRMVPMIAMLSALSFTYQGLWAGPWLRDVGGQAEAARATLLLIYAFGLMSGNLLAGQLASRAQARGVGPILVPVLGTAGLMATQIWLIAVPSGMLGQGIAWFLFAFFAAGGPSGYAAVGQGFPPALAGRVATAVNFSMLVIVFLLQNGIGWVLDLWPRAAHGGWDSRGYGWALAVTLILQAGAALWLLVGPRDRPA
ncbi:MFS transporter [Muricoccus radiodurans]|uniref:MFS transporter n=1 Tax=Muricoccus radiodurans TaxID=2231721 RepID=UPI003CF3CD08